MGRFNELAIRLREAQAEHGGELTEAQRSYLRHAVYYRECLRTEGLRRARLDYAISESWEAMKLAQVEDAYLSREAELSAADANWMYFLSYRGVGRK